MFNTFAEDMILCNEDPSLIFGKGLKINYELLSRIREVKQHLWIPPTNEELKERHEKLSICKTVYPPTQQEMEQLYIKKIENAIRALKLNTKSPAMLAEEGVSKMFDRLKAVNEGMHEDLMKKYDVEVKEYNKRNKDVVPV